ncbi:MAG: pyruvate, phosphate dikinase [Alphaproteobacteria bacterium]|nr:pyruvate, phosphate dikinase [Alphaproteobacteria bacterium]
MTQLASKYLASFGKFGAEGARMDVKALGHKGLALCDMTKLGLAVPPGFILTVECAKAIAAGQATATIKAEIIAGLGRLTEETGCALGDYKHLLLLAVRPSMPIALPGTLEAVLNLVLNDETVEGLSKYSGDPAFAHACYRRFIQNYAHVVMGDDPAAFEDLLSLFVEERGYVSAAEIKGSDGYELTARFKSQLEAHDQQVFPQDVHEQLWSTIVALVRGWNGPRAKTHRKIHGVDSDAGLAIIVQAMVFGNQPENSGTGHAASRHPQTGDVIMQGEYLVDAQGPDLVARMRQSLPLSNGGGASLQSTIPEAYAALHSGLKKLEALKRDAVDVDFTVSQGQIWFLDAKPARRTTAAAIKIVADMVRQGLMTEAEALLRIDPLSLDQLLHSTLAPGARRDVIAAGLPASPGAASGMIIFDADEARVLVGQGQHVILVRPETSPEDIKGVHVADGVLTTRGGMTSHAAVIARGMGKPCVAGASSLKIDANDGTLKAPGFTLKKGDVITIDGSSGQVLKGEVAVVKPSLSGDFAMFLGWADKARRMKVRTNAETPHDARIARDFGAEGIGLSRTEHMFFEGDRIIAMREMILADSERDRRAALAKILPVLRADFEALFAIMAGLPVCIRLLDPPLHEFLPSVTDDVVGIAKDLKIDPAALRRRVAELREQNPMLGHRGVRLLLSYPEITDMQARAIFEAAANVAKSSGKAPIAEIMVPLVSARGELEAVRKRIDMVAGDVRKETGQAITYLVGTMIELPRAALKAQDIAKDAEFFSFGTNDLTQTTYGISRDDSARFIGEYTARGIFQRDPFISLDVEGVGELISFAVERGRLGRPDLHLGICGEHGGDPDSIAFCEASGLDYVSCSPFRVPIARLAAAQATLKNIIKPIR